MGFEEQRAETEWFEVGGGCRVGGGSHFLPESTVWGLLTKAPSKPSLKGSPAAAATAGARALGPGQGWIPRSSGH